jgi:hypothetical protein
MYARIDAGMTRASTYSHDSPAAGSAPIPSAAEAAADLAELQAAVKEIEATSKVVEKRREPKS